MRRKTVYAGSLMCIMLASGIFVVWTASSRLVRAYSYTSQFAAAAKIEGSSTNLSLVVYGDPQPLRPSIELFQYVTAQNIEWRGTSSDPQGNAINVAFKLGKVNFGKLNENNFNGTASGLDSHVSIGDLVDVAVKADNIAVNMTFWTYMSMLPAVNLTGVLTGNVYVKLSIAVLPFPGLDLALYEFSGDRFAVSLCAIKPMNLAVQAPANDQMVGGDVLVQAMIQAVPELSVENVRCWTDYGENMPMHFNQANGLWECVWPSYHNGNGGHMLNVHAEAVATKSGQEFRYPSDVGIKVEVNNPWVNSYIARDQGLEGFGGLQVKLKLGSNSWNQGTGFNFWPSIGLELEAQEYWANGAMHFNCWRIDDEKGNTIFKLDGLTLTITQDVANMLFDGTGMARELKCIYVPTG